MDNFKETYFPVWQSAWAFHKQFSKTEDTEAFWESVIDASEILAKKYRDTEQSDFAKSLVLAVCGELERAAKARQQSEKEVVN